ncbi:hypothetical protein [Sphaerisporangium dianthi]|uniref:Uncharacterized protein n=1 Tax=Sphaerisporangium dianthi TaxID=1436120 RepID=A0ABV9CFD4_9ACTN
MERRHFLRFAGGLAGAGLLTSCTDGPARTPASPRSAPGPAAPATPAPARHIVYADVSARLAAVDAGTGTTLFTADRPLPSAGWERLYTISPSGELLTLDALTGEVKARAIVPPGVIPRAVSSVENVVALAAPPPASPYGGPGRTSTTVVVVAPDGRASPRTVRLAGNFQPDALTGVGDGLFVLQYLPATAPESYKVKIYDLEQKALWPLSTREKKPVPEGAEETMRGDGRASVLGPARQQLYTLYTHQPGHLHTRDLVAGRKTGVHAFVHVLELNQRWAYCLDLPEPFGRAPAAAHTIAATGGSVYVYEDGRGTLARASTESLTILATASIGTSPAAGNAAASSSVTQSGLLYLAAGPSLRAVDPHSLVVRGSWRLPSPARGVVVTPEGDGVYVGVTDGVLRFDGRDGLRGDGQPIGNVSLPGLSLLRHAAPSA